MIIQEWKDSLSEGCCEWTQTDVSSRIREGHLSSFTVQLNSHTLQLLFNCQESEGLLWGLWAVFTVHVPHAPDISENLSLPLVWCCGYSKNPECIFSNLHIPAVCSWIKALRTQNTRIFVKPLWIIRNILIYITVGHTGQIRRECEVRMSCVWI